MNLLFISPSRIGDAILATGVLQHMIARHSGIAVTIAAPALTMPLFEAVPGLAHTILLEKMPCHLHWIKLWQKCLITSWDIIIDIRGSPIARFLKCRKRYIWRSSSISQHRVEQLGNLINATPAPAPHIWLDESHFRQARQIIPSSLATLAISPAANWIGKQWPLSSFQQLITQFLNCHDACIAIFAAPEERDSLLPLVNSIPGHKCLDLVGKLSLLQIAACLGQCRAFIGNDSGLMHMAAASGIPVIGLFGPSNETLYGPYSADKMRPNQIVRTPESFASVQKRSDFSFKAKHTFMENLKTQTVFDVLKQVWNQNSR